MIKQPKFQTAILIMCITVVVLYGLGARMIFKGVAQIANEARLTYEKEAIPALIILIEDETADYDKRNTAIWALGQIGAPAALPALQRLDTNEVQNPPYDSTAYIMQYSVEKAIKQIRSFSMTRWMYRGL